MIDSGSWKRKLIASARPVLLAIVFALSCGRINLPGVARGSAQFGHGQDLIAYYGCGSCHTIPGIRGADAMVGPPLEHIASRSYIGVLTNTRANMSRWIQNPKEVDRLAAMPYLGVTSEDADDIVAYLYTLK